MTLFSLVPFLAATLLAITLVGCGDTTSPDTKKFLLSNSVGDPPLLRILRVVNGGPFAELVEAGPSDAVLQGVLTIAFNVKDTDTGGEIDILGEYSTDNGASWTFAAGYLNPSPPAVFAGGATTYMHDPSTTNDPDFPSVNCVDYVWDSVASLGVGIQIPRLMFRLTPTDRKDGGIPATVTFALDNQTSVFAPEADQVSTPSVLPGLVVPGANVTFTYRLKDSDLPTNLIGICPQFAVGGTSAFTDATEAPSPPSVSEGTFGLTASASGVTHVFVWDSAADFLTAGVMCSEDVTFRVLPKDIGTVLSPLTMVDLEGIPGDSQPFIVANFPSSPNRGSANVPTPIGTQSGCIQVPYSIADADSSPSAAIVEFSTDGGLTFQVASENNDDPESDGFCGSAGIVTSPVGIGHVFAWDTISDGLAGLFPNVVVRVTPFDGLFGTAGSTAPFVLDNPGISAMSAPGIIITTPEVPSPPGYLSDAINIGYQLFDFDSDPVDIFDGSEFSTDGGMTFLPATFRNTPAFSGNATLTSSPCGTAQIFVWDSLCDGVGLSAIQNAIFRLTPTDINGVGAPATTASFAVQNSTLPTIAATEVLPSGTAPFTGGVQITYVLQSTVDSSCATIVAEYTLDGVSFFAATQVIGPPSDGTALLSSGTTPVPHTFVWDSVADAVGVGMIPTNVLFRIRPALAGVSGSAETSVPFTVENP